MKLIILLYWLINLTGYNIQLDKEQMTIGILNNNPGNIKRANSVWKGQIGVDKQGHVVFSKVELGLRAMARVLKNYYLVHKLDTIDKVIERYVETRTEKDIKMKMEYKYFLSKQLKINIHERFNILSRMPELMMAMVYYENGINPYPAYIYILAGFMEKIE